MITLRADGDANFYQLGEGKKWLAVIQLNGELMTERQMQIMQRIVDELNKTDERYLTP